MSDRPQTPQKHVQLRGLGHAVVTVDGTPVAWAARSAEELLWFLHAHPTGVYQHDILRILWNLDSTAAALNRFRVALHRLRVTLGDPQAVTEHQGRYQLHVDLHAASDTAILHEALRSAHRTTSATEKAALLQHALEQARGPYLAQFQGDWVEQARTHHRAAALEAQLALSAVHCATSACTLAAQALTLALQEDPLASEEHHQRLMACLTKTGGPYAAIEHYRRYRHFLKSEVGDTPMPATETLAARLKAGERPCLRGRPDFLPDERADNQVRTAGDATMKAGP